MRPLRPTNSSMSGIRRLRSARHAKELAIKIEQTVTCVVIREAMVFGQVADFVTGARLAGRLAKQQGLPFPPADNAEQHLDERCLARTVLTEQAIDLALVDIDADTPQGLDLFVVLGKLNCFNHRHDAYSSFEVQAIRCKQFYAFGHLPATVTEPMCLPFWYQGSSMARRRAYPLPG